MRSSEEPLTSQPKPDSSSDSSSMAAGAMGFPAACPPGLECLTTMDTVLVQQQVELAEVFLKVETNNKYAIKNTAGQIILMAEEDTDLVSRAFAKKMRRAKLNILDSDRREVMKMQRKFVCMSCCLLSNVMEISSSTGPPLGRVVQYRSCLSSPRPKLMVENASGETVFTIIAPLWRSSCCGSEIDFKILSRDGQKIGKISKQYGGLIKETFTDADNFGITFPVNLDVSMKAVLLGACFLIDFMFFEN